MKKKILITICLVICCVAGWQFLQSKDEPGEKKIDAISYNMSLDLDTDNKVLKEDVEMVIKNNTDKSIDELIIRNMSESIHAYNKKNYKLKDNSKIKSIKSDNQKLDYTKEKESIIKVKLKNKLKSGSLIKLNVSMETDIPNRMDRFGYVETDDGYIFALSFCFPYLEDNDNGEWVLHPYFDDGESRSHDIANYSITLKHPKKDTVVSTGKEETKGTTTSIQAEDVRDMAIVVSNMFYKDELKVKGKTINNYYLKGKHSKEYRKLSELVIKDSMTLYTDTIGEYIYDELDIVPFVFGFGYGGMEYPGLIMLNATSFIDGNIMDPWTLSDSLSHEIAHQWFYAAIGNDEYAQGWIDEGFSTYLERQIYGLYDGKAHKYLQTIDDLAPSIKESKKMRDELVQTARTDYKTLYLDTTPDKYSKSQNYGDAEYEEAYVFLQELRSAMGDSQFHSFLKELYTTYQFKTVDTTTIISMIKDYDNSKKVNDILEFYFKKV